MLREGVGGEVIGGKEAHVVALVASRALAASDATDEAKDDFVFARRLTVGTHQPLYGDLESGLLACLADYPFPWRLTGLHAAAGLAPPVAVRAVDEQHATGIVKHSGEDADLEAHAEVLSPTCHICVAVPVAGVRASSLAATSADAPASEPEVNYFLARAARGFVVVAGAAALALIVCWPVGQRASSEHWAQSGLGALQMARP